MMRVRTVTGITYFCRTGKSFKGQVQDRFLLADCRAVLSGNYSFMWSYEKIHRCIAHLFLGELVTTFDEEFRILFAQSQPLTVDQALVVSSETGSTGNLYNNQFGLKRTQSMRNTRSFLRQPELPPAFPYGDSDRNPALPFRRNELFRHTMEPGAGIVIGKYAQQQFRLQQSFLEQGRSIVSRQMEMSSTAFKRHSYAEGTQESYSSSRQFMKQRVMNNLEETDFQREQSQFYREGPGPGSGHGHYDRLRGRVPHLSVDQYSDSSFPSEPEPPPANYGHGYLSSDDLRHNPGHQGPPAAGRYGGGSGHKRPTMGQSYACQSSPTHLHPPEKHQFPKPSDHERDEDSSARQGLRSWRISSYLNTCEDGGEEGLPQPMGPDAFEDPQPESSGPHFGTTEPPNVSSSKPRPDMLRPRFGKPIVPENPGKDSGLTTTTTRDLMSDYRTSLLQKDREREAEKEWERGGTREMGVDVEGKEAQENTLIKHESFRTRINPLIQRSSRLRSSLIFSSSKLETHNSGLGLKPATEEDDQLDTGRTSSIVAQILEKRRSITRDPFEWRKKTEEKGKEEEKEKEEKMQLKENSQSRELTEQTPKATTDLSKPQPSSSLNMNDPASRLQYFKDLAAKRKASKMGIESSLTSTEPAEQKSEIIDKPPPDTSTPTIQSVSVNPPAPKQPELTPKPSVSATKPPVMPTKPSISHLKISEPATTQKEENVSDGQKKEPFKALKSFPSPKPFKRDGLKLKSLNLRRVSTGEEILTTDATDAEKSEQKKNRSQSSSSMTRAESKDGLHKNMGSTTSINTLGGEGKGSEGKPLDFLKKQTQRLKGFLGPKDKDKKSASTGDEKSMNTVMEITEAASKPASSSTKEAVTVTSDQSAANHKVSVTASATGSLGPSRYQTSSGSVLFSSNLRDDTKVILEQISANSQKNRQDREEGGGDKDTDNEKSLERHNSLRKNRFLRPQGNTQEREGLLKRIESMRKEKKVYSRFEMGNSLG